MGNRWTREANASDSVVVEQQQEQLTATMAHTTGTFPDGRPKRRTLPRQTSKRSCGSCHNCMVDDCGYCRMCLDKAKFGGSNRLRQACVNRPPCLVVVGGGGTRSSKKSPPQPRKQPKPPPLPSKSLVFSGPPEDALLGRPWPAGWRLDCYKRRTTTNHLDRYFFTPAKAYRLRSIPDVKRFLNAMEECGGQEEVAVLDTVEYGTKKQKKSPRSKKRKGFAASGLFMKGTNASSKSKKQNKRNG